jgi:hypothetical protein
MILLLQTLATFCMLSSMLDATIEICCTFARWKKNLRKRARTSLLPIGLVDR